MVSIAKIIRGGFRLAHVLWALLAAGICVLLVAAGGGGTLLLSNWYPFAGWLWPIAMVICLAHGACFVGLLLRRPWSRPTAALLAFGWALLPVWQLAEQLVHGHRVSPAEYATLIAGTAVLSFLGYHILSSRRINGLLGSDRERRVVR